MKAGWQTKKLGELCNLMTGGTPSRARPEYFGGAIRWLVSGDIHTKEIFDCSGRITDEGMKNSNAKLLPIDSVMIALNGQGKTRGSVALLRTEATCNQSLVCISPKDPSKLLPEFLYANLHGRYQEIRRLTSDADNDRRGLNMPIIRNMDIPIAPIQEQQRIVAILDEAFDGIATARANTEKNLQNARALFESHLQSVFIQRGEGWVDVRLEDVCGLQNGFAFKSGTFKSSGEPILRISNIQDGRIDAGNRLVFFDPKDYRENLERYRIVRGDLLIAMSGATTGKLGFNTESTVYYLNQRVGKFEPSEKLNKFFLYHFLSTKVEENLNIAAGAAQPNLSTEQIKGFVLPLPSVEEQGRIVEALEVLLEETQRLESLYQRKLAALDDLKKSLLHQAFSGEL